jgi:(hydroxyamino)benzene mutase
MDVQRGGQEILLNGMALVLVGLLWGLVVPHTPYPRLALGAHIQFELNGLLLIVMAALLLKFAHDVGPRSILVMRLSAWLTWAMALSEVANSWWGTSSTLPIAAHQAGAAGGLPWQENAVTLTHVAAGLCLIVAWALLILGFARSGAVSRR